MFPKLKWHGTRRDWRQSLPAALAALSAVESQVPELGTGAPPVRAFRKAGRWLVAEDASAADPALVQIFRANGSPAWALKLCRSLGEKTLVRSHAQAMLLKSNLRAFYPSVAVTVKVANPGRPQAPLRFANEITSRRRLVDAAGIGPPRMYASSEEEGAFLAEELVDARPVTQTKIAPREIARRLLDFHRVNGIDVVPAAQALEMDRDYQLYAAYSGQLGVRIPAGISALVAKPEMSSALVACALCHGDLTVTNLMLGREKLFINDWEWAERTLLFADAVRLATQLDGFDTAFLEHFTGLPQPAAPMLEPRTQFLLAAVHVGARRIARRSDFSEPRALRAYERRLKDRFLRIARLIDRLSDG